VQSAKWVATLNQGTSPTPQSTKTLTQNRRSAEKRLQKFCSLSRNAVSLAKVCPVDGGALLGWRHDTTHIAWRRSVRALEDERCLEKESDKSWQRVGQRACLVQVSNHTRRAVLLLRALTKERERQNLTKPKSLIEPTNALLAEDSINFLTRHSEKESERLWQNVRWPHLKKVRWGADRSR